MANITELQLQGDSTVHKLNDSRITTTAVTTATHILTTNSDVTSIAPITAANLASVLGVCFPFGAIGSLTDADDISNTCMAYIWNNSTGLNPVFTYYYKAERAFQFAIIDRATIKFRYKWNGTWNAWYDLT